jgi:hypothetical protein
MTKKAVGIKIVNTPAITEPKARIKSAQKINWRTLSGYEMREEFEVALGAWFTPNE